MPKVPLALLFDRESNDYFGASRYWSPEKNDYSGHCDYIEAEVEVTDEIARAIELTKPIWCVNNPIPQCIQDDEGHGQK